MPNKTLAKIIGERLRLLRKTKGYSQEELAHLSNLHPTYIGQLERGEKNATLNTIEKVTDALNVSIEELFQFSNWTDESEDLLQLKNYLHNFGEEDRKTLLKMIEVLVEWKESTNQVEHTR